MNTVSLNEIVEIVEFFKKYEKLYNNIMKISANVSLNTLHKITKNLLIADKVFSTDIECDRYFNFVEAFSELDDTRILVNIEELDMYLIFTNIEAYSKMMKRIYDIIIDQIETQNCSIRTELNFTPYQIVLSNQKQKIVFLINGSNDNDIDDIRKHCFDLFKCDTEITYGKKYKEITVQLLTANLNESKILITQLNDYLRARNALLMNRVDILPIGDMSYNNKRYYSSFIGKMTDIKQLSAIIDYDFARDLKYLPENRSITLNVNVNGNGNVYIGNNMVNNNGSYEERRQDDALTWISANLPKNGDSSKDFYDFYKLSLNGKNPLSVYKFNKIVVSFGYENKKTSDNIHRWILR